MEHVVYEWMNSAEEGLWWYPTLATPTCCTHFRAMRVHRVRQCSMRGRARALYCASSRRFTLTAPSSA